MSSLGDLWSSSRPDGIRFCCNGRIICPGRTESLSTLFASVCAGGVSFFTLCALAYAFRSDALVISAIAVALVLHACSSCAAARVVFGDSGAIEVHASIFSAELPPIDGAREISAPTTLAQISTTAAPITVKFCVTCRVWRPPGARHCGACGHCVAGYDHHCGVLARCVGERSLRAFVVFELGYALTSLAAIAAGAIAFAHSRECSFAPSAAFFSSSLSISAVVLLTFAALVACTCGFRWGPAVLRTLAYCFAAPVGLLLVVVTLIRASPLCASLVPAFAALLLHIPALAFFTSFSLAHGIGVAEKRRKGTLPDEAPNDEVLLMGADAPSPRGFALLREVVIAFFAVLRTTPPPPRIDFSADAAPLIAALARVRIALFHAVEARSPAPAQLEWVGACADSREAVSISVASNALVKDVEAIAREAANIKGLPKGVLALTLFPAGIRGTECGP